MIEQKLKEVVKNVLQVELEKIDESVKFKDMDIWDSMTFMMFVVQIEQAFQISLTDDEILELDSIKSAKEILNRKLNQ